MRRSMNYAVLILVFFVMQSGASILAAQPRTFIRDPRVLEAVRASINSGAKEYAAPVKYLKNEAEKALSLRPVSVTEKKQLPPSGDRHDYMSLGKYWWPDPATKDGLPYIRRDGEVNPEVKDYSDENKLNQTIRAVTMLAYASYYIGDPRYSDGAAALLRFWFLDSLTRMNPNLNFAQAVPGRNDGRGSGIIDAHQMPGLIDALGLLNDSPSLTRQDREGLTRWFRDYLRWLRESKNGKKEAEANNNHGTWYDVQVVATALYLGESELARTVLTESREKRIAAQIEPDGTMPKELARTRSFGYSLFDLDAFATLSLLGERAGVDLWQYHTADGRSIHKVLDHLLPFVTGDKKWEGPQIAAVKLSDAYLVLMEAARVYQDAKYADAAAKIPEAKKLSQTSLLLLGQR